MQTSMDAFHDDQVALDDFEDDDGCPHENTRILHPRAKYTDGYREEVVWCSDERDVIERRRVA